MSPPDAQDHEPWWFVPILYAGIFLAVAAIVLTDLIAGWL